MGNRSNLIGYTVLGIISLVALVLFKYNKAKKIKDHETLQEITNTLATDIENLTNSKDLQEKLLNPNANYLKILKGEE